MTGYSLTISEIEVKRYRLMAAVAAHFEREYWLKSGIREGAEVVDIGCGPAAVSSLISDIVGPTGRVVGVDSDDRSLVYAAAAAAESTSGNIEILRADAADSGLQSGTLDVAVVRHVLVHNGGREQAIVDHAASLVRPGGYVFLAEFEGTAARIRPETPDLDDLADRYAKLHASLGNDFSIGLRLRTLVEHADLDVVEFVGAYRIVEAPPGVRTPTWAARDSIVRAGLADQSDIDRWDRAFQHLDALESRPTMYYPVFIAIGRKKSGG